LSRTRFVGSSPMPTSQDPSAEVPEERGSLDQLKVIILLIMFTTCVLLMFLDWKGRNSSEAPE
jgi:hypothetical protein